MKPIRVVLTSSRNWTDQETIWKALDTVAETARELSVGLVVAHGCAPGGDLIADAWVRERAASGWPVEPDRFPADWRNGRGEGLRRNARMLRPGADMCLAFVLPCEQPKCTRPRPHGSHGTTDCGEKAEAAGIRTVWADPFNVRGER